MCSKGPVARMHSFTYFAQWCGVAASEDAAPGCCAKHFRPEPIPKPWPQNLDPSIWPPQYNPASPCRSMKLFNCCCKIFPLPFGEEYRANPDWKPPYGGGFPHSFTKEFDPNGFASTVEVNGTAVAVIGSSTVGSRPPAAAAVARGSPPPPPERRSRTLAPRRRASGAAALRTSRAAAASSAAAPASRQTQPTCRPAMRSGRRTSR